MRKIVMIAILVVSMVQGVFAQQIIIKGTVKDATRKRKRRINCFNMS